MDAGSKLAGRYRLVERLGSGGMSEVWRARDTVLDRDVAVKVLDGETALLRRMAIRTEALAAAKLAHAHVARVFDYGESEEGGRLVPFVVMELLEGSPLSRATLPMPPALAFQICAQVAAALAAAHAQGVVHRDVKPGNVMLTADGVKVFDFGIAAEAGTLEDAAVDSEVVGTPTYMAPERLTDAAVTPATDVYSVGVLLYRLLTKNFPWTAKTPVEIVAAHVAQPPADLPRLPGIPAAVGNLYRRCLAKDPYERPPASEVAFVLATAAGLTAPPPVTPDSIGPVEQNRPSAFVRAGSPTTEDGPTTDLKSMYRTPALIALGVAAIAVIVAGAVTIGNLLDSPDTTQMAVPVVQPGAPSVGSTRSTAPASSAPGSIGTDAATTAAPGGGVGPAGPVPLQPVASTTTRAGSSTGNPPPTSTSPAIPTETFESGGGSIVAGCYGDQAVLLGWDPAPTFIAMKVVQGPEDSAEVTFRHNGDSYLIEVTCPGGVPKAVLTETHH
jgi:serine/threonine-protein kinase